jgi:hypothetical protein
MAIKRSDISSQLIPGLNAVFGTAYKSVDNEHKVLFDIEKSNRSFEEESKLTGLGSAQTKTEGGNVSYDEAQEHYKSRYNHETIALGYIITEEAFEDDLYDSFGRYRSNFLGHSMANTKQVKAADVFNNGFNTSYAGGDGVPLFSASHPDVVGTTQSNTVAADLSETALENALIALGGFRDDRGILISTVGKSLHIPRNLQFTAFKILKSDLSTTVTTQGATGVTNVNDTNALKSGGFFPGGIHMNQRFTDTNAWFIRTDCPHGSKMFVRTPLQIASEGDFDTGNLKFKARERYSFGWSDWRQWYGSSGGS